MCVSTTRLSRRAERRDVSFVRARFVPPRVWTVAVADCHAVDGPGTDLVQHQISFLKRRAQVVQASAALGGAAGEWQSASSQWKR